MQADIDGDGTCVRCTFFAQHDETFGKCVPDAEDIILRLFFLVIGIVGAGTLLGAMSLRRFKLVGRRLKIEEISSEGGSMLFTTIGPHCLRYLGGCQIPVTLEATGHFLLDSNPTSKKVIVHKVRVKGPDRLEILDQAGNSFGVRADSSMDSPAGRSGWLGTHGFRLCLVVYTAHTSAQITGWTRGRRCFDSFCDLLLVSALCKCNNCHSQAQRQDQKLSCR